jgi:organic radical activating enzyme
MSEQTIPLVEKFFSVQGEGFNAGRSSAFIRFAGCNLDCVFADGSVCDTPWQKFREKPTIGEILEWLRKGPPNPLIILTGGEPTIHPAFDDLVQVLAKAGFSIAVETNGTTWRPSMPLLCHIVVSPKDQVLHKRDVDPTLDPAVVQAAHEFRFVIAEGAPKPPWMNCCARHYVSPAMMADGSGLEWKEGVPDFANGALERCLEIVREDPRWRISLQTHKWMRVR